MEELNKKIIFACYLPWDVHWMYEVIKATNGSVYTINEQVRNVCYRLGIPTVQKFDGFTIMVVSNIHLGVRQSAEYFINTGGKVVMLQHAWDTGLQLRDRFWNHDMNKFTYILVGCTQDYDWLSNKYGKDRIILTGMPKLDNLYRIKNDNIPLDDVYKELNVNSFYLSIAPTDVISNSIFRSYDERLEGDSPLPVVFKVHPGSNFQAAKDADISRGKTNRNLIPDDIYDVNKTYRIMKASSGVVCVESFFSIEATLLGKPVIFYGYQDIPGGFYNKDENINQNLRAPFEMSSSLAHPKFTEKQKEIADMYLFDGKNTERVVTFLKGII